MIELPDGQWCAFEIKLGANQIDATAGNLLEIKKQIKADPKGRPPAVLCVLCGMANAAYQRPDGVFVVPVTALRRVIVIPRLLNMILQSALRGT